MSGWVLGLGVGLAYLEHKKVQLQGQQERAMDEYYRAGKPSGTVTTEEVRAAWKDTGGTRYKDM